MAFVIPMNEASSLGQVIERIPIAGLRKEGYEAVVFIVDGFSVDHTRDVAVDKGAQIILEKRKGKRADVQTAFKSIETD